MAVRHVRTPTLEIAYEETGAGAPVILLHGFPYAPRAFDNMVPLLTGCRVIVPYLRGYGPTRFLSKSTMRSGEQAALGNDLKELMDALQIERAVLCGYDWGGRAACIVAALWPERVAGLVTGGGYNMHDVAGSAKPASAEQEHRYWYQYYFHTERGRAGLTENRRGIARLLWTLWSPNWRFDDATFERSAASFDNPDFVAVVIQSYRHRYGYAAGDPALMGIEAELARQPKISVPTINLHGGHDGVGPAPEQDNQAKNFTGPYSRRLLPRIGHNVPQEAPEAFAAAVMELVKV
jgi:pimeloyl-ACP methyl ester carboxylesterase